MGQGAAGVATAANLAPADSFLLGYSCRVTQAPGGGATQWDLGRTAGLPGSQTEIVNAAAVALGTQINSYKHATPFGFEDQAAADTLTVTTDLNVAVSDMKILIVAYYVDMIDPS